MAGDVSRIQERLAEARFVFEELDEAIGREDWPQAEAWCIDLLHRLRGVRQDVIQAGDRLAMGELQRRHPR